MLPSRMEAALNKTRSPEPLKHASVGLRKARFRRRPLTSLAKYPMRTANPIAAIAKKIALMRVIARLTVDERKINPLNTPRPELRLERPLRGERPRKYQDPRRPFIKALHHAELWIIRAIEPPQERTRLIDERISIAPLIRQRQNIRRLIDDGELSIREEQPRALKLTSARASPVRPIFELRIRRDPPRRIEIWLTVDEDLPALTALPRLPPRELKFLADPLSERRQACFVHDRSQLSRLAPKDKASAQRRSSAPSLITVKRNMKAM